MKKYRISLILLSLIIVMNCVLSMGAMSPRISSENSNALTEAERQALDKYDTKLKTHGYVLKLKEHGHLESFLVRLNKALDKKIATELPEKLGQIKTWGLDPQDTVKDLELHVLTFLNEKQGELQIGTSEFDRYVIEGLSDSPANLLSKARKDAAYGPLYLYACIYNYHHNIEQNNTAGSSWDLPVAGKTLEELFREDTIRDFADTDSLSVLRSYMQENNLDFSPPWPALNGQAIESYARAWANSRNNYYRWYDEGNDCTNFASQALFNGGLYMTYYTSDETANGIVSTAARWFYFQNSSQSTYSISTSFIRVLELYSYLAPNYATFSTTNGQTMTTYLNRGFLLQGKQLYSNYSHSVIVTLVSGALAYCAHSNPRYDEAIQTFYNGYYTYRVVQVY